MSSTDRFIPLQQKDGYGIIVGVGFAFAICMMLTTAMLKRYNKQIMTAEEFATAGRTIKTGLISAAVVSSWTWSATLLNSTAQVYNNGIAGSFAYAAGATVQIVLFACLAIKGKQIAPNAHSYLEIIKARYGTGTHITYIFFGYATNILVTAMLLTGGSAVVSDLTGMNVVAACLLLPLGVVIYTMFGGIKATFLTDYVHTVILVVIIFVFAFVAFATSDTLGSPGAVWEIVTELAFTQPREGNSGGSYLTMKSRSGFIFFVINIVGNFGTVFLDNGYFNKAFAADPAAALPGYVLGGLAWFAIPALTSLTLGLTALSLEGTPAWPTYPRRMTSAEVSAGLVLPNAATALLGKGGSYASLLMVFMAVTSAMSAELIAVSTVFTYDIYRPYINPKAKGKNLIFMSHVSVVVFAYTLAGFAIGLYYAGISMGYLYELMGIIIGGGVLPAALTLLWGGQNKQAAMYSPIIATGLAIMSWLISTKTLEGTINVDTTFMDNPMLIGNVVALCSPLILVPLLTFIFKPQNFDWDILKTIKRAGEEEEILEATQPVTDEEKLHPIKSQVSVIASQILEKLDYTYDDEQARLKVAFKRGTWICLTLALCLIILWPMPMYGTGYIFSKKFFTGWVVVMIMWLFFTSFTVVLYPIWEGRDVIGQTVRGIYWDCTGQTYKLKEWQNSHPDQLHIIQSQVEAHRNAPEVIEGKTVHAGQMTPVGIDDQLSDEKKD